MKNLLCALLVIGHSFAIHASSEFERGYLEGKKSCSKGIYSCSVTVRSENYTYYGYDLSRSGAILDLVKVCKDELISSKEKCLHEVNLGKINCKKL